MVASLDPLDPLDPVAGRTATDWDDVVARLPEIDPWPPGGPIVLVAPHPDDELLAAGATLAAASDAGTEIRVLAATDGELSHPYLSDAGRRDLVERRLAETAAAYAAAGIEPTRTRLSLPDFGAHGDADAWGVELAAGLAPLLDGASVCLAPWPSDGHPDHDVCGRVAAIVAAEAGVTLISFPVWSWNWDDPSGPQIPFPQAARFDLDNDLLGRKRAGIDAYASQIRPEDGRRPVLPAEFLAHFTRPAEVFLLPPDWLPDGRSGPRT